MDLSFGNITLASGSIQKNTAIVDIAKGDVVALNNFGDVILATNEYVELNDSTAMNPVGVAIADTKSGELCVYSIGNAVINSDIAHPTQDHRWYLSSNGKVCSYSDLSDGDYVSVVAIPDTSNKRSRLVLDKPVTVKNPCWSTSSDVPVAPTISDVDDDTGSTDSLGSVTVNWIPSSNNTCEPIKQRVYQATNTDSYDLIEEINGNEETSLEVGDLVLDEQYSFKVSAVNYNGEGLLSEAASITPVRE
jgi:hypothetical protein